jgi:hypothetical protein
VTPLKSAAKVRIVPIEPVAAPGHVVGFVITVAATTRAPGVLPRVCVSVPRTLRVIAAPGAVAGPARLCWELDALVSGRPRSFRFSARVVSPRRSTTTSLKVPATLTGQNLTAARATATVLLPPRPVGCSAAAGPPARIAC